MKHKINSQLYRDIGKKLKHHRKQQSLTIRQLANKLNRSRDFIIDAEQGQYRMSLDKLYQYCEVLGVNLKSIIPDKAPDDDIQVTMKEIKERNNRL